ncbi:hypothetical protein V491_01698 [Pseudogymnoascus sp. VKM F-3775]|nr:hypothetical protein V491_01698 [Pseudogymnoascus sp. VKM F-3775]
MLLAHDLGYALYYLLFPLTLLYLSLYFSLKGYKRVYGALTLGALVGFSTATSVAPIHCPPGASLMNFGGAFVASSSSLASSPAHAPILPNRTPINTSPSCSWCPQNPRHLRPPPAPTHLQWLFTPVALTPRAPPNHRAALRELHPESDPHVHLPFQRTHRPRPPHRCFRRAADAPTGVRDDSRSRGASHDLHPLDNAPTHTAVP